MNHFSLLGAQSFSLAKKTIRRALSSSSSSSQSASDHSSQCKLAAGNTLESHYHLHRPSVGHDPTNPDHKSAGVVDPISCSDVELQDAQLPLVVGVLHKWTNYIHGWQPRYFVLQGGTLAYYKSEDEIEFGCRGAITVNKAIIQANEFDDCRIDISVNDCIWYLRSDSPSDRQKWIEALEAYRADSGYGSQGDLCRHGSLVSLTSNKSLASSSSFKFCRSLNEKLSELATYCEIVHRQIDVLQSYFDATAAEESVDGHCQLWAQNSGFACSQEADVDEVDRDLTIRSIGSTVRNVPYATQEVDEDAAASPPQPMELNSVVGRMASKRAIDFRGEALTFKATSSGILSLLQHCVELMQQREDVWKKRFDQELERRRRAEGSCRQFSLEVHKLHMERSSMAFAGPDYEEGPHSALNEDEWYDAVDAALEKQDLEDRRLERLLTKTASRASFPPIHCISVSPEHHLFAEIDHVTTEQVRYALQEVEDGDWQLFSEDGEMKMYKREMEIDGLVCDPLKAVHYVKGISALEYLHYFYEPEYKMDWDTTLENVNVIDRISEDTMILHQVHKRVWPASQREALFWSHIRRLRSTPPSPDVELMVVCNHDTCHSAVPLAPRTVRVGLTIAMVCQTIVHNADAPLSRDNVSCKIIYVAQVNPGGWAPSSVLRVVYKREYPKFLKRFTQYVQQKIRSSCVQL